MKAVTIAKIARLIVIISVAVVLAIPTFAGLESLRINNGEFIETESVYDLSMMSADDLKSNMKNATDLKSGYTLMTESKTGTVSMGGEVPTSESELQTLAQTLKADATIAKVTLLQDGKVVKQQMITGSTGFKQFIIIGLKMTGSMVNMVTPSGSLDSVMFGERNKISDIGVEKTEDSYRLTIEIPYLLFASAIAGGENSNIGLSIGIEYNSFFTATFSLDLPISKFFNMDSSSGGTAKLPTYTTAKSTPEHPLTYEGQPVQQIVSVDVKDMIELEPMEINLGSFGTDEGGIKISVNSDGTINVVSDKEKLVDALYDAREDDGTLVIDLGGGAEPIVVDAEQVESLKEMLDELIKNKDMLPAGMGDIL